MDDTLHRMERQDWRLDGACLPEDPDVFSPVGNTENPSPAVNAQIERAKSYCRECGVARQCLEFALRVRDFEGIYGNTTGPERRAMTRPE